MHRGVLPLRVLILVDKKGADSFVELGMLHVTLTDSILHLEDILGVHVGATLDLLEDYG